MLYGGGKDSLGENESTSNNWLPGFSSTAGGFSPGGSGAGTDYPSSPNNLYLSKPLIEAKVWRHYTWKIYPERLELYMRNSGTAPSNDELVFFMQTPNNGKSTAQKIQELNTAHSANITELPKFYHYFEEFNAFRFYNRWGSNFGVANLSIKVTQNKKPEEAKPEWSFTKTAETISEGNTTKTHNVCHQIEQGSRC